jgi:hypothetical protein
MASQESDIRAISMCRLYALEARGTDHEDGKVVRKDSYGKIVEQ